MRYFKHFLNLSLALLLLIMLYVVNINFLPVKQLIATEKNLCQKIKQDPNENQQIKIVGLGDSLTAGIGDETGEGGYIGNLVKKIKESECATIVKNYSLKGLKSNELLNLLEEEDVQASIKKADIITFTIGANDLLNALKQGNMLKNVEILNKAERLYDENIERILKKIRTINKDVNIYYIGLYNPLAHIFPNIDHLDLIVTKWNNISKNNVEKVDNTYFVPIDEQFSEQIHLYLAEDYFHPNHQGYEAIAKQLIATILNEGE